MDGLATSHTNTGVTEMPKIAVISVAHIHSRHFCEIISKTTSGGAPVFIWDDNADRGAKYAADFKCRFEPDLDKAAAAPEVDAFVVCAENTRHLPLLKKLIPTGKPIMCEKPLATKSEEADEIFNLAQKHNTPIICGYHLPFSGMGGSARKLLADEALGKVTHINFRNAHHAAYGRWFDNPELAWFTNPELSGGGALLDMGTHAVQFLRHLGGAVEKVWADIRNLSGIYSDVDDYGLIVLQFKSGVIGRVEAGWIFTGGHAGLEIIGSKKSVWNSDGLKIGGPGFPAEPVAPIEEKPRQIERLIEVVKGNISKEDWKADLEASRDAVKIMEAAYKSAKSGTWVAC